jgi:hypothetical protein
MTASAQGGALHRTLARVVSAPALTDMRWVSTARACYGLVLLALPAPLIAAATGAPASRRVRVIARVLGGRQVAQGMICGLAPVPELIEAGAATDGLHAASMLMLAASEPRLRRALLAEAAIAAALAGVAATSLHRRQQQAANLPG